MTGFELYLQENGFTLRAGSDKALNTYDNSCRSWIDDKGYSCLVGLFAQPTRIGITHPVIFFMGEPFTGLPTPYMYKLFLDQIRSYEQID